jgi:hypothetical protein
MKFEVFNRIIFDNEMNIVSCLSDAYVCAALTVREILEIVPLVKEIMDSNNLSDISFDIYEFIYDLPISQETLEEWEENGLNKHEKFFVALAYSSAKLEDMRYHVCKMCDAEYFSTDVMSDFCDICASKYKDF